MREQYMLNTILRDEWGFNLQFRINNKIKKYQYYAIRLF